MNTHPLSHIHLPTQLSVLLPHIPAVSVILAQGRAAGWEVILLPVVMSCSLLCIWGVNSPFGFDFPVF